MMLTGRIFLDFRIWVLGLSVTLPHRTEPIIPAKYRDLFAAAAKWTEMI
jgi:hypothetical protein